MARNLFSITGAKILPGFCFVLLFFDRGTVLVVSLGILSTSLIFWFFFYVISVFSLVENNFLEGDFITKTKKSYALHICCILSTVVDSQQTCNKCCKLAICENRWEKWKKTNQILEIYIQYLKRELDLLERVALPCADLKRKQGSETPPPSPRKTESFFSFFN